MTPGKKPALVSRAFVHRTLRQAVCARVTQAAEDAIVAEIEALFGSFLESVASVHADYATMLRMQGLPDGRPRLEVWHVERAFTLLRATRKAEGAYVGSGTSVKAQEVTS